MRRCTGIIRTTATKVDHQRRDRMGDYKLIEFFEDGHLELYNLANDIGERHNLAQAEPAKAADLHARLVAWRESVGAAMPRPNPAYDAVPPIWGLTAPTPNTNKQ